MNTYILKMAAMDIPDIFSNAENLAYNEVVQTEDNMTDTMRERGMSETLWDVENDYDANMRMLNNSASVTVKEAKRGLILAIVYLRNHPELNSKVKVLWAILNELQGDSDIRNTVDDMKYGDIEMPGPVKSGADVNCQDSRENDRIIPETQQEINVDPRVELQDYIKRVELPSTSLSYENVCPLCRKSYKHVVNYKKHLLTHKSETKKRNKGRNPTLDNDTEQTLPSGGITGRRKRKQVKRYPGEDLGESIPVYSQYAEEKEDRCSISEFKSVNGIKFENGTDLDENIETINEQLFSCTHCEMQFQDFEELTQHVRKHPMGHICTVCGMLFSTERLLDQHNGVAHGKEPWEKSYGCDMCYRTFEKESLLVHHRSVHMKKRHLRCEHCTKCFSAPDKLKLHLLTHTREKPFPCPTCGVHFRAPQAVRMHQRTVHEGYRKKKEVCDVCGVECTKIRSHMRTHTGEKPHACKDCGKCFSQSSGLHSHSVIHTGERRHVCSTCGKQLQNSSHLRRHERLHTGERPHQCVICGKGFIQSGNLKIHMKVHKPSVS